MQAAYKNVDFGIDRLLKLSTPQRLRQNDCLWYQPLSPSVNCTLQVIVEYFDSDSAGESILLSASKQAIAECNIWTYPVKDYSSKEPFMTFTELTTSSPALQTKSPPENQNSEITYPGWFAIDFGTSNSTVMLYDPKVIVTPYAFPKEQEVKLGDRLAAWIGERPADDLPGISCEAWAQEWQKFLAEVCKNLQENSVNLRSLPAEKFLEAIREIEIGFRRAASKRLNRIYHEVFRVPSLEWQSFAVAGWECN